jgi:protease-4
MKRFLIGLFAAIGVLAVLLIVAAGAGLWWLAVRLEAGRALPDRIVLDLDLRQSLEEVSGTPPFLTLLEPRLALSDVVLALDRASRDGRVTGLVARLDATDHGFAAAQEVRDAIGRFRASGRFAFAFADSFGELSAGNEGYYLATAFDQIHLQPVGLVGLTGLMAEIPFVRRVLDQLGVELSISQREQYKTAFDSFTQTGLTPANREMLDQLLDSLAGQLRDGIAKGRRLDPERVRALIDGGPYTDQEALAAGLVDRLDYWDEVLDASRDRGGETVSLRDYARASGDAPKRGTRVAFLRAAGTIQPGGQGLGSGINADPMAEALEDAIDADEVKAILLRLDSPGGSPGASETIARQIRRAGAANKPVIVSMGNAAASGGYWVAMDATAIVAQPATFTGSIGVIAGKPVLTGLWEKLGVEWAQLPRAANAAIWSFNAPYSERGRARLESILDAIYGRFKEGVARGRKLPPERVEALAQGRVWTGSEAVELGLVDRLGGLFEAQQAVRDALGLAPDAPLDLHPYPEPRTPLREALDLMLENVGALARVGALLADLRTLGITEIPEVRIR